MRVYNSIGNLFSFMIIFFNSKRLYFNARPFNFLSKILAFLSSGVKDVNFAGTTSPTSLFLFPVTCVTSWFSASACRKKLKSCDSSIGTWPVRILLASGFILYTSVALRSYSFTSARASSSHSKTWLILGVDVHFYTWCPLQTVSKLTP